MRANVKHLRDHGPTPIPDLPHGTDAADRLAGLATFRIETGAPTVGIAYLVGEHGAEAILRAFFEANPRAADMSRKSLAARIGGHGSVWREAFINIYHEVLHAD